MHIYYFLCMQNFESIMCRSWYVFLLITGTERRSAAKIKMRDWVQLRDRSIIDFSVVHLYLFRTEHAVILYTMNEDAVMPSE